MNRPLVWISGGVIVAHLGLLVWMGMTFEPTITPHQKPRQLLAKTVELKPERKQPPPLVAVKPKAKPKAKPKPKPELKSKSSPKPEAKRTEQTQTNRKKQQLLAKAQQQLSQVDAVSTSQIKISIPDLDLGLHTPENSYYETLMSQLQTTLRLAESGEVNLRLTLKRDGTVAHLEILSSKSGRNQKAVSTKLPTLTFSPFGKAFGSEKQHTFLLTLTS